MTHSLISRCLFGALLLTALGACSTENKTQAEGANATPSTATTVETDSAANTPKGGAYVCPMHPDVTSDQAGNCPQCGMALQKQG